jgi:enoyl-CoA hydratase/carnithine racemase
MSDMLLAERTGGVLALTLNRPTHANALSSELVERLMAALDEHRDGLRLVILRGNGRHFCSGFDLSNLESTSDGDLLLRFVRIETLLQRLYYAPFLSLALAHGRVIGAGVDLVCACSFRIAEPGTCFRMPGWRFGIALGTRRLLHRVGSEAARAALLESRLLEAEQARGLGLVQRVLPEEHWGDIILEAEQAALALEPDALANLLAFTAEDSRAADMAALVATASRPGLQRRIRLYRDNERAATSR